MRSNKKVDFANSMVAYAKTHNQWASLSKEGAAFETVMVILDDIGAAQGFLNAIDVNVDLYTSSVGNFQNWPPTGTVLGSLSLPCGCCYHLYSDQASWLIVLRCDTEHPPFKPTIPRSEIKLPN